jgi:hypothetical protein
MLLAAVGVTVIAATCMCAVGVHAGGVQTGLGGVLVGVTAIVSVVAMFVAVPAPLDVRMRVAPVRMTALTFASTSGKGEGEHNSKKEGENRRSPTAVHGGTASYVQENIETENTLRKVDRLSHGTEQSKVAGPQIRSEIYGPEACIAVRIGRVKELHEGHFALAVTGLRNTEQIPRAL